MVVQTAGDGRVCGDLGGQIAVYEDVWDSKRILRPRKEVFSKVRMRTLDPILLNHSKI